ncbi:hypothetical protein [Caballeronia sp. DA-9]|uniref:hypothetical protein n=1 Tax=Caballeronia sp. DA-9 TaxID=3436237 RepID=UPI003F667DE8
MTTGGPAFPVPEVSTATGQVKSADAAGMTLRDYFAAAALPAILARVPAGTRPQPGKTIQDAVAESAYEQADAMIRASKN